MSEVREGGNQERDQNLRKVLTFLVRERACIDDLLPERITGDNPNHGRYKFQTNWWQGIKSNYDFLLKNDLVDDRVVKQEMEQFVSFVGTLDFEAFRTREEIDHANAVLDIVIPYLESQVGA